jgi:hypothetical protein
MHGHMNVILGGESWGFYGGTDEDFILLGYDAASYNSGRKYTMQ